MNEWSVGTLQRALLTIAKEGAAIAARAPEVRHAAPAAQTLGEAFPDDPSITSVIEAQLEGLRGAVGEEWDPVEPVLTSAVEAALVVGARAIAAEPDVGGGVDDGDQLAELAQDELWLDPHVKDLLAQVVNAIAGCGVPLPGARSFLMKRGDLPSQVEIISTDNGDQRREVRTDWIADPDSGKTYQWAAELRDGEVVLRQRFRGERQWREQVSFSRHDAASISQVIRGTAGPEPV